MVTFLQNMNPLNNQFSSVSSYFFPLRPKYLPQYPQPMSSPSHEIASFTPTQNYKHNYSHVYFNVCTVHLEYNFYFNQQGTICVFHLNNIYVIITPTCFDTFVSSPGRSKVVLRQSYVVSILLNFH